METITYYLSFNRFMQNNTIMTKEIAFVISGYQTVNLVSDPTLEYIWIMGRFRSCEFFFTDDGLGKGKGVPLGLNK